MRPPYICFWFFGTLGGLFWVWFLVFENFEIVFWIRIPTFGGVCFMNFFYLMPPYICFWFFLTLGSLFLSLIFTFWKFWNWILNQNSHFWGGLFYETFWFEAYFSTGDDFIASSEIIFLVPFLATKETLAPLANDPIM